jgi:hypothetical protein
MRMKPLQLTATLALCLPLIACNSTSEQSVSSPAVSMPLPQQRSYLDPGPSAPRSGSPNYVRANQTSTPRQTDFFGNDILPQNP